MLSILSCSTDSFSGSARARENSNKQGGKSRSQPGHQTNSAGASSRLCLGVPNRAFNAANVLLSFLLVSLRLQAVITAGQPWGSDRMGMLPKQEEPRGPLLQSLRGMNLDYNDYADDLEHPDHNDALLSQLASNTLSSDDYLTLDEIPAKFSTAKLATDPVGQLSDLSDRKVRRRKVYVKGVKKEMKDVIVHPIKVTIPVKIPESDVSEVPEPKPLYRMQKIVTYESKPEVQMVPVTKTIIRPEGISADQIIDDGASKSDSKLLFAASASPATDTTRSLSLLPKLIG